MVVKVQFTTQLPFLIKKRRKHFLASCPILDVHSQGETQEQAKNNLADALVLFFQSCFERGTLDEVLKESGFQSHAIVKDRDEADLRHSDIIDISIPLFANA